MELPSSSISRRLNKEVVELEGVNGGDDDDAGREEKGGGRGGKQVPGGRGERRGKEGTGKRTADVGRDGRDGRELTHLSRPLQWPSYSASKAWRDALGPSTVRKMSDGTRSVTESIRLGCTDRPKAWQK